MFSFIHIFFFFFFFRLKDLNPDDIPETVEATLNYVNLNRVRDHPASSFSGGMKVFIY